MYPLVMTNIANWKDPPCYQWVNPLFQWPCSIANCNKLPEGNPQFLLGQKETTKNRSTSLSLRLLSITMVPGPYTFRTFVKGLGFWGFSNDDPMETHGNPSRQILWNPRSTFKVQYLDVLEPSCSSKRDHQFTHRASLAGLRWTSKSDPGCGQSMILGSMVVNHTPKCQGSDKGGGVVQRLLECTKRNA